ncbi:TPA: formylglycine-generating enzyme family protein, partial [Candidatus Poribacteria bacterium]|nr:formylglycine-generating enzyme family protein [Candidatus Poribacteria bacterium]
YSNSSLRNPQGPSTGEWRVLRGGSWYASLNSLRVAYRVNSLPSLTSLNYGFRCVSGFPAAQ